MIRAVVIVVVIDAGRVTSGEDEPTAEEDEKEKMRKRTRRHGIARIDSENGKS
jgi:hypothetical protein